jgi:flagellar biosynthesis protein FlhF
MKIKNYTVDNMEQAYEMILKDLGNEALILKAKQVRKGGLAGLFRKKKIEVVAVSELAGITKKKQDEAAANDVLVPKENMNRDMLLKELSEMKNMLRSMKQEKTVSFPEKFEKWAKRLHEQEVDQDVIDYVLKKAAMICKNPEQASDTEIEQIFLSIIEQLLEEGIAKELSHPYLITAIGPTGVGKTTTIAKLAAMHVLQQKKRVGLLTTDTYPIAAVEQLKTYANILNVPVEVAADANEFHAAMERLKGCHIIFMDSAGRNYLEGEYIEEINQFLQYNVSQENYLVISMTTRWRDIKTIVQKMKEVPIDKLIFTKWDETTCYGAVLNMLYHYPYPLSYICVGQGVPQDIMAPDPVYIAKKILGVDEHAARPSISFERVI